MLFHCHYHSKDQPLVHLALGHGMERKSNLVPYPHISKGCGLPWVLHNRIVLCFPGPWNARLAPQMVNQSENVCKIMEKPGSLDTPCRRKEISESNIPFKLSAYFMQVKYDPYIVPMIYKGILITYWKNWFIWMDCDANCGINAISNSLGGIPFKVVFVVAFAW